MWSWLTTRTNRITGQKARRAALRLEALEAREVPAVLIQVDYSLDTGFFANNPDARAVMDRVASELGNSLSADLPAISPTGANTWTATFYSPTTGAQTGISNLAVGANTIKVYVGGRAMPGSEAGYASSSGNSASGSSDWVSTVQTRNWGGSISFDTTQSWFFGQSTAGLTSKQLDFYSVATHELGHVLGIGTSALWNSLSSGGTFHGANAMSVYGGAVPLGPDGQHWANGLTVNGQRAAMEPSLPAGVRVGWSSLDAAALRDLGWGGGGVAPTAPVANPQPVVVAAGGALSLVAESGGTLVPTGARFTPFPGYTGELHVATGDFNGDGATDYAVATGTGTLATVAIVNGRDGSFLVPATVLAPGYNGGFYLAAGDIDGDGKAELVVAAGTGAPVVGTFRVSGGGLQLESLFTAFDAGWFTGGIRVAAGDLNRDGYADVVVTTASSLGAVATYSGADLRHGVPKQLFASFVPLAGSPLGLNAAVGDMDGDGYADLALTFERGGPAFVAVWSGAALTRNSKTPANQIGTAAAFLALPGDGARLSMRDMDGDGRADLVVAGGSQLNPFIRAFTFAQAVGGGGGASASLLGFVAPSGIYVG